MIEPLTITIWKSSIIGLILGIILAFSKKAFLIIWGLAVLVLIISFFSGAGNSAALYWSVGNWIAMVISVNVWEFVGYYGIKSIKEEFFGQ